MQTLIIFGLAIYYLIGLYVMNNKGFLGEVLFIVAMFWPFALLFDHLDFLEKYIPYKIKGILLGILLLIISFFAAIIFSVSVAIVSVALLILFIWQVPKLFLRRKN